MNGWTPTIETQTRINNLLEQIPQEYRARACRECYGTDDFDFERNLTAYVLHRTWETYDHPVNEAEFVDGFCDPRYNNEDIAISVAMRNVEICHPADKEYFQKRLDEEIQKRNIRTDFQQW